jgi:hypothetical protein
MVDEYAGYCATVAHDHFLGYQKHAKGAYAASGALLESCH